MELSRQLDRESKIKTTMDLRQLRGEDDDKDSEAMRDLEQIEMDKINLNKIKIKKHKKEDKVKMDEQSIIKKLDHESEEQKKDELMKLYKDTMVKQMKDNGVDEKTQEVAIKELSKYEDSEKKA